jgi:4-alpha-glucanotransferase
VERITSPEREYHASIQFTYYVQYHLHRQLLDASQHAARLRITLKGDLPIGKAPAMPRCHVLLVQELKYASGLKKLKCIFSGTLH